MFFQVNISSIQSLVVARMGDINWWDLKVLYRHEKVGQDDIQSLQSINPKVVELEHVEAGSIVNMVELLQVNIKIFDALEEKCQQLSALVQPQILIL